MTVAVPHLVTSRVLRVLGVSKAPIIDSIGTASSKCVLLPVFVLSAANRMVVARVFVGLVQILVLPILLLYFWCALGVFLYEVHQRAQTLSELSDMRAGRAKAMAETAPVDALLERLEVPIRVVEARDCGICLATLDADDAIRVRSNLLCRAQVMKEAGDEGLSSDAPRMAHLDVSFVVDEKFAIYDFNTNEPVGGFDGGTRQQKSTWRFEGAVSAHEEGEWRLHAII